MSSRRGQDSSPRKKTSRVGLMALPFPTFPDDDGYKSPIFLYLAYHGKNEMQQMNMNLEDQYAFGEDPGLLENLEIGEGLAVYRRRRHAGG